MTCPICQKNTDPKYRPFCSKRCADIDLGRWLTGSYVIPGDAIDEEEMPPVPEDAGSTPPRRH
ncbi:MAG: DNA gyrase inhibitor YacG [Paracoccaceae bacterium]